MFEWNESDREAWHMLLPEGVEIIVHRYVGCGDAWFLSCYRLRIDRLEMKPTGTDAEPAKREAMRIVANEIRLIGKVGEWLEAEMAK